MGIVIRQSLRNLIISYLGFIVGYFNILWFFPKMLGAEQIGLLRFVQDLAILLAPFIQFGLYQGINKFFPEFYKQKRHGNLLFTSFGLASVLFLVFLIAYYFFSDQLKSLFLKNSEESLIYFPWIVLLTYTMIIHLIAEAYLRANFDTVFPVFIREVFFRLGLSLLVFLYFLNIISFPFAVKAIVIIYAVASIILIVRIFQRKLILFSGGYTLTGKESLRILDYCFYTTIGAGGMILVSKIDTIMIAGYVGLEITGIYAIAFAIATVIDVPKRALIQVSIPLLANAFESKDLDKVAEIYRKSSLNMLIIGLFFFLIITVNIQNLYKFIPNHDIYIAGISSMIILGLMRVVDMAAGLNGQIIIMSQYYRLNSLFIGILAILSFALNMVLVPKYGMEGAAIASLVSIVFFNLIKYLFLKYKYKLEPFSRNTAITLLLATVCFAIVHWLPGPDHFLFDVLFRSVIFTFLYGLGTFKLHLSTDIDQMVIHYVNKMKSIIHLK